MNFSATCSPHFLREKKKLLPAYTTSACQFELRHRQKFFYLSEKMWRTCGKTFLFFSAFAEGKLQILLPRLIAIVAALYPQKYHFLLIRVFQTCTTRGQLEPQLGLEL